MLYFARNMRHVLKVAYFLQRPDDGASLCAGLTDQLCLSLWLPFFFPLTVALGHRVRVLKRLGGGLISSRSGSLSRVERAQEWLGWLLGRKPPVDALVDAT